MKRDMKRFFLLPGLLVCMGLTACKSGPKAFKIMLPARPVAVGATIPSGVTSLRREPELGPGISHALPVEEVRFELHPKGIFEITFRDSDGMGIELKALKPGTATIEAWGKVDGKTSRVTGTLTATAAARSRIAATCPWLDSDLLCSVNSQLETAAGAPLDGKDHLEVAEGPAKIEPLSPGITGDQHLEATGPGKVRVRSAVTGSELTLSFPVRAADAGRGGSPP